MTAVISYIERNPSDNSFGSVVFVGDMLISGEAESSDLLLPTIGEVRQIFPDGSGFVPVALRQKLVRFGPNFAAGWSGPLIAAQSFFADIRDDALSGRLTPSVMSRHLMELERSAIGRDLNLIFYMRSDQRQYTGTHSGLICNIQSLENVWAIGSGARDLEQIVGRTLNSNARLLDGGGGDSYSQIRLGQVLGKLMTSEVYAGTNLLNYYGGGYEALTSTTRGFEKIDRRLHVFMEDFGPIAPRDRFFPVICRIVYQRYIGESLLVNSFKLGPARQVGEILKGTASENFSLLVPPVYRTVNDEEVDLAQEAVLHIDQEMLNVHVRIWNEARTRNRIYTTATNMPPFNRYVGVHPRSDGFDFEIHVDLISQIHSAAEHEYLRILGEES